MRPIERPRSLTGTVLAQLRESIVSGDLELGAALSERVLAEKLGVSKTPVREALAQLRVEGLVRIYPQRGAYVFTLSARRVLASEGGDVTSALVRFASGATGCLNAILVTPLYLPFTVFGSKAWVEVRNDTHPDTPGPSTLVLCRAGGARRSRRFEWTDTVRANLEAFADAILGRSPYPFTDAQMIANVAVLEALCESARTGHPVGPASWSMGR